MHVAGSQKRAPSLALQQIRQLGGSRGLTRALQAHEHDDVGRAVLRKHELGLGGAQELRELVKNDAHHVLCRRQGIQHVGRHALFLARGDEVLHHAIVDVRFQERHANLTHRGIDVVLGKTALAA